jgi:PAS domain S-box-containing protein
VPATEKDEWMRRDEASRTRSRSADRWPLSRWAELDSFIADFSRTLIDPPVASANKEIHRGFQKLLRFFKFDRVELWEFLADRDELVLLHHRQRKGTSLPPMRTEAKHFHWAKERLLLNQPVIIRSHGDLPPAAHQLLARLEEQGIRLWLALPLRKSGVAFGALVFVADCRPIAWNPQLTARLQTITSIFGSVLARVRVEEMLRVSELLNNSILDSLESKVAVIDRNAIIAAVNARWADSAANKRNHLLNGASVGVNYLEVCRRSGNESHVQEALRGISAVLDHSKRFFELEVPCDSPKQKHWSRMTVTPLIRFQGGAVISHTDVTGQKRAEAELSESEARFRKMADEVPVIIWMHGPDKNLTYVNKAVLSFSGLRPRDFFGRKWPQQIHPDDRANQWSVYNKAFDSQQKFVVEYRHAHVSGQYRWLLVCGVPRYLADGSFAGYIGVSMDIHDRKEMEDGRSQFAGQLLRAQEEERSRIGRELHDDFAQRLALLTIQMQELEHSSNEPAKKTQIAELRKQTHQLSVDVTQLSHRLHSSYLDNFGLPVAVKTLCKEVSRTHHIEIDCNVSGIPPVMGKNITLVLFRVLQEALHNIVKHSRSTKVRADLSSDGREIRLQFADNGVGLDIQALPTAAGLGLISMKERLHFVGGSLSLTSQPSLGTRLEARVPLAVVPERTASIA